MLIVDDMRLDTYAHVQGNVVVHVCKPHPLCTHIPLCKMAAVALKDSTGYGLTCGSDEALSWFNKAIFAYTTVRENGVPFFKKALELDSSIVLAHCVLVCHRYLIVTHDHACGD